MVNSWISQERFNYTKTEQKCFTSYLSKEKNIKSSVFSILEQLEHTRKKYEISLCQNCNWFKVTRVICQRSFKKNLRPKVGKGITQSKLKQLEGGGGQSKVNVRSEKRQACFFHNVNWPFLDSCNCEFLVKRNLRCILLYTLEQSGQLKFQHHKTICSYITLIPFIADSTSRKYLRMMINYFLMNFFIKQFPNKNKLNNTSSQCNCQKFQSSKLSFDSVN